MSSDVSKAPERIAGMFDAIADRYDFLNHLLSAGIDRRWRRRAVRSLGLTGRERLLDLCTGTGDLAIAALAAAPPPSRVVGVDFSAGMLDVGRRKLGRGRFANAVSLVRADAIRLPIADGSIDAATVAFGIRNVENVDAAFAEMRRVLRPGGRLAILELTLPTTPLVRRAYLWYFNRVLPGIGRLVSRHGAAYGYLPASVGAFVPPGEFTRMLDCAGFVDLKAQPLTFGIVCLYTGARAR